MEGWQSGEWMEKVRPYRWVIIGIGTVLSTLLLAGVAWMVPSTHAAISGAYHAGKRYVGWEKAGGGENGGAVSPTADPIIGLREEMQGLEKEVEAQKQVGIEHEAQVALLQAQFKTAVDEASSTNDLLKKQQQEWLKAMNEVGAATVQNGTGSEAGPPSPAVSGKVSINTGTAAQLDSLPGIGETYAKRIIEYRSQKGPFTSLDDLMNVSGIGQAVFDKLKDLITL